MLALENFASGKITHVSDVTEAIYFRLSYASVVLPHLVRMSDHGVIAAVSMREGGG